MKSSKNFSFRKVIGIIGKIISWVLFAILLIAAIFLLYYYVATKIYAAKGTGYEPKFSLYTIVSPSMTPNINVYDVVVDVKMDKPEDIKVGDVISFISTSSLTPGKNITHRVIAITEDSDGNVCYKTKGDYNAVADDSCAKFNNILGKVFFKIPQLGRVQRLLASRAGWLLFIIIPALYVIIKDILKITKLSAINDKASKISDGKKVDQKKLLQEQMRKDELKRKLLKEQTNEMQTYYCDPVIKTIDKQKFKSVALSSDEEQPSKKNNKKNKKKKN